MAEYTINVLRQQFTQVDMLKAINAPFRAAGQEGLSHITLNNWVKRELLPKLSEHSPGSGKRRLYSMTDAVQIAALMYMTNLKIPVGVASNLLHFFRDRTKNKAIGLPVHRNMGELTIYFMPNAAGELLMNPIYEKDVSGNPIDISFLKDIPGFISLNVDFIIEMVGEELSKILAESGESEEQDDDGLAFELEIQRFWQKKFSESVIELEELEQKLKQEGREPTQDEENRLLELKRDIEDGKLVLKDNKEKIARY
jgi:hypothetical protein